ncbi:hypothetical protein VPH35_111612 [Triticum aestivum]
MAATGGRFWWNRHHIFAASVFFFCGNRLVVLLHGDGSVERCCPARSSEDPCCGDDEPMVPRISGTRGHGGLRERGGCTGDSLFFGSGMMCGTRKKKKCPDPTADETAIVRVRSDRPKFGRRTGA